MCLAVGVLTSFLRRCMHLTMCEYSICPTYMYMYVICVLTCILWSFALTISSKDALLS